MKLRTIVFGAAMLGAGLWIGGSVFSQDKGEMGGGPSMEDMMKVYEKFAAPGEQHKQLASATGDWDVVSRMFMMPGAPPMESKGSATYKMELGGRFQRGDFQGTMMGKPFTGIGYTGYDNFTKKYLNIWMDSMGTTMMFAQGTASADGKTITFEATMDDPATGEIGKKCRYIVRHVDEDNMTFEMHDLALEKMGMPTKVMELIYKRKKTTKS